MNEERGDMNLGWRGLLRGRGCRLSMWEGRMATKDTKMVVYDLVYTTVLNDIPDHSRSLQALAQVETPYSTALACVSGTKKK